MTRQNIFNKVIEEQQKVIDNLQEGVDRYKSASDLDEDNSSDPDDYAHQSEAKDMQLRYENLLREAKANLSNLEMQVDEGADKIGTGSIIVTDKFIFFIGISIPKTEYKGKELISFSEDAPIFSQIKDKKRGDIVTVGNHNETILEVL